MIDVLLMVGLDVEYIDKKSVKAEQQIRENSEPLKTIHVKNADGDPDTVAEILIQNKHRRSYAKLT